VNRRTFTVERYSGKQHWLLCLERYCATRINSQRMTLVSRSTPLNWARGLTLGVICLGGIARFGKAR
jgi:hypothetical protein